MKNPARRTPPCAPRAPLPSVLCTVGAGLVGRPAASAGRAAPRPTRRLGAPHTCGPGWTRPCRPGSRPAATGAHRGIRRLERAAPLAEAGGGRSRACGAGPLGRFVLRFPAPEPGRYPLSIAAAGRTAPVGVLVVRPLLLDAVGDVTFGEQVGPAVAAYGGGYPWTGRRGNASCRRCHCRQPGDVGQYAGSRRGQGVHVPRAAAGPPRRWRASPASTCSLSRNNHTNDYGAAALLDTIRYVRAAGIKTIGGRRERDAGRPRGRRPGRRPPDRLPRLLGHQPGGLLREPQRRPARPVPIRRRSTEPFALPAHMRISWSASCTGASSCTANPTRARRRSRSACLGAGAQVVLGAHPHVLGADRPADRADPCRLDARKLRVPVDRCDSPHRHPPGSDRRTRRSRLPASPRRDRRASRPRASVSAVRRAPDSSCPQRR